jgi:protein subunit release factor A
MINEQLYKDTDIRVIDQRIGMGIGGLNTVIRLYHKPTGILIEMPRLTRSQYYDKQLAFEMLEYALASDLEVGNDG